MLPFEGGLADQPVWLLNDWGGFMEITEFNELLVERENLEQRLIEMLKHE